MPKPRPRKKKSLDLFPERPPDAPPPERRHVLDGLTFQEGWVCLRCGRGAQVDRRTVLVFFDEKGRESVGLTVCRGCASMLQTCLIRQTRMTPICAPPEELAYKVEPAVAEKEEWEG